MRDTNSKLIISVGTLADLVSLREAVLKKAGYRVVSAFNEAEALAKICSGDCGVLLLCYSVEEESRKRITRTFREVCPEGRIVSITNQPFNESPDADAIVYGVDGAEALISTLRGDVTSKPLIKGEA
jgi:DNA-binding NarL/FixJ family response regulator